MKIAVLHNYMDNIGGAEKLVLAIAKKLKADIFTTNINRKGIKKFGFENINIKNIGRVPQNWPNKQLKTFLLFRSLKLKDYDVFIISGEWALAAAKKNKPALWYVHSLPKHIYDFYEKNLTKQKTLTDKNLFKLWSFVFKHFLYKYSAYPSIIAGNSNFTQRNLIINLKRDSILLYPPVNIDEYYFEKYGDFWLSVNRISEHKRIELQLETFFLLPKEKLFIVGGAEKTKSAKKYYQYLKTIAPKNVSFLGEITDKKLKKLYADCKGFIATTQNEDFGITPIEAMASGKPVVAVNQGGYKETIDNSVGALVEPKPLKLVEAMKKISKNPQVYKRACLNKSRCFSSKKFFGQIKKILKSISL